ncbi:facilitated trehalose transporter Tret1-like [Battus philenor]|uniref:facilitated trehalose transporter Tret1-like n=1 Tax=Battus philenor TaxID=42288 RepID=UPI0035D0C3E5
MTKWLLCMSTLARQCIAILGVSLGMTSTSHVVSFTSVMLPQLKEVQDIDDEQASWIASINGISLLIGLLVTPSLMSTYGRRIVNLMRSIILSISWGALIFTTDVHAILFIRFIQGFCLGLAAIVVPVLIGEYSSPKYRGVALTTISLAISMGVLTNHTIGTYFSWKIAGAFCCGTTVFNTLITLLSPESPTYLASRGKFDQCKDAFRWLRYPEEEEELEKMISKYTSESQDKIKTNLIKKIKNKAIDFFLMWKRKEFYKPVIIILHLHIINEWSPATVFDAYTTNIVHGLAGKDVNIPVMLLSTDILRAVSSMCAVIVTRKCRRRPMFLVTISCNILSYIAMIVYSYLKTHNLLEYDHPMIGKILIHIHVFTFSIGNITLPNIFAGEIFVYEYRGISNMIGQIFFCMNYIVCTKTALHMMSSMGLHGMLTVYASLVAYALVVTWFLVPETKDKTLQEIEEEYRGKTKNEENAEVLNSLLTKVNHVN